MKIVKFRSGKYAIRRGIFFYGYKDLRSLGFWWGRYSRYVGDCVGTLEQVMDELERLKRKEPIDFGKVIKIKRRKE